MSNLLLLISIVLSFLLPNHSYIAIAAAILLALGLLLRLFVQKHPITYIALTISVLHVIMAIVHISLVQSDLIFYISQVIVYIMMFTVFFISTEKSMGRAIAIFNIVILFFYFVVKMLAQDAQLPEIALAPIQSISIVLGIVIVLLSVAIFIQDFKRKN